MKDLEGRVAVVTGAGSGIGLAMARRFAEEGMKLAIADIEAAPLDAALAALRATGAEAIAVRTDVMSEAAVDKLADEAFEAFGAVHLLCNNAGVTSATLRTRAWEAPVSDWNWILGVNFMGVLNGVRSFVPRMLAGGEEGHIVNTASVAGLSGGGGPQAYSATKAAVISLTQSTAVELAQHHIRVNAVCPGAVYTDLLHRGRPDVTDEWRSEIQPWPERGQPEMIADVAVWLAGEQSRFVTGEAVRVDGGLMAATPRLMDHDLSHLQRMAGIAYGNTGRDPEVRRL